MTDDAKPKPADDFASKASDLATLRDAVVDAAGVSTGLWLSYLFVFFYLAIAAGAVTHRDLFLENAVKLPFLGVELPLLAFFVLGPLLFLVIHAYVLLHFVLLAGKAGAFDAALYSRVGDKEIRSKLQRALPSNIFVQLLAGAPEMRAAPMGWLLRVIAWVSLALGPVALLAFFELQFLPYHGAAITWWQRIAVVADVSLLWILWPSIARGKTTWLWRYLGRRKVRRRLALPLLVSLVPVALVYGVATFPGEWLHTALPPLSLVPVHGKAQIEWTSLHELLVAGDVDLVARKPRSLWSNRLVLSGIDVADNAKFDNDAKIAAATATFSLRGRRLEGAVLLGARLRKADFTAAKLQGAYLDEADLREAKFGCANRRLTDEEFSECANLDGASLWNAKLQAASLDYARLKGASLAFAQLQGTSLRKAELQAASLYNANLDGASLDGANLKGAILSHASLQGTSLAGAVLDGADIVIADMAGADLRWAHVDGALIDAALVWRADPREYQGTPVVIRPIVEAMDRRQSCAPVCSHWSAASFAAARRLIEANIPEGSRRSEAIQRIARLDPLVAVADEEKMEQVWIEVAQSHPPPGLHANRRDEAWDAAACRADDAPYVAAGLLRNLEQLYLISAALPSALAVKFLDMSACPGVRGLSAELKEKLEWTTRDRSRSSTPSTAAPR